MPKTARQEFEEIISNTICDHAGDQEPICDGDCRFCRCVKELLQAAKRHALGAMGEERKCKYDCDGPDGIGYHTKECDIDNAIGHNSCRLSSIEKINEAFK